MRKQALHPKTVVINTKQKNLAKLSRTVALQWLVKHFPKAFDSRMHINPLKIGIMADILVFAEQAQQAGISKSKLREAVVLFTRRIDYLTCLKAGGTRIDLDGNPAGLVDIADAEKAHLKIKKRIEKKLKNTKKIIAPTPVKPTASPSKVAVQDNGYTQYRSTFDDNTIHNRQAMRAHNPTGVNIMHKQSRQYDPNTLARLKEKLGLKQVASNNEQETID